MEAVVEVEAGVEVAEPAAAMVVEAAEPAAAMVVEPKAMVVEEITPRVEESNLRKRKHQDLLELKHPSLGSLPRHNPNPNPNPNPKP